MDKMEITSLSSRGQIVIPQNIRDELRLQPGEKFVVMGEDDTILLKKVPAPSFDQIDKMLKKMRAFAKQKGITPKDVKEAIQRVRRNESST
ncbi:MAG: AbrB/MazE/SpoVT family DNA-binding domain-containing protein [Nanoarchaeota archaeon]|nr:AbrB/MazE/SpoVT family DNA-binding domain-containing protein [Nanoarchaeota archaeon]